MKYKVTLEGKTYEIEVEKGEAMLLDEYEAIAPVGVHAGDDPSVSLRSTAPLAGEPSWVGGATAPEGAEGLNPGINATGTSVTAPLPGNVLSIKVAMGESVKAGQLLLVIEAMKMENEIVAPADGVVKEIACAEGKPVSTGDTLMII